MIKDLTLQICQGCHSPRYTTQLLSNGDNMLEIATKNPHEADKLINQASVKFGADKLLPTGNMMKSMLLHLNNVYAGIVHQSPDYQ